MNVITAIEIKIAAIAKMAALVRAPTPTLYPGVLSDSIIGRQVIVFFYDMVVLFRRHQVMKRSLYHFC